jgi:integrase
MNYAPLPIGTEIAALIPISVEKDHPATVSSPIVVKTIGDLLTILHSQPPRFFGVLKTTCRHLGTYLNQPSDQLTFETISARKSGFRSFLASRQYAENSISQYVYQTHVLLMLAQKHGWDPDHAVSREWKKLLATASEAQVLGITKHFSRITRTPAEITVEELDAWEESKLNSGSYYASARSTRNRFLRFLQDSGWPRLNIPGTKALDNYGVSLDELPSELSDEILTLLKWKQVDFAINRPKKGKIRPVSAGKLRGMICQLAGYAVNVRELRPSSFKELVQQSLVEGFAEWMINERGVKGRPLKESLGMILAVVKYHPSYTTQDWTWFKSLMSSIPEEPESERRQRKAQKYVEYEVLEAIPAKIHAQRKTHEKMRRSARSIAGLAMEELVMRWLTILPWRQFNLRQSRIGGPSPNLFKARIPQFSTLDKPKWVLEQEEKEPATEFWQVRFSAQETKTGIAIHHLLPKQLIHPLEDYLEHHRPNLLRKKAIDTLLVNSIGNSLDSKLMQRVVGDWTLRCAGLRTTPHLYRDAVAFQWLKEHPADFLTLSKMLWHKSIETTIGTYGSQFNESSGVRAMEEWRELRDIRS